MSGNEVEQAVQSFGRRIRMLTEETEFELGRLVEGSSPAPLCTVYAPSFSESPRADLRRLRQPRSRAASAKVHGAAITTTGLAAFLVLP